MAEFGHQFARLGGAYVDSWGAGPYEITVGDQVHRFEDSAQFGPLLVRKDDRPSAQQWPERDPFWRAHRIWVRQGRRLEDDGRTCIWDGPKPTLVFRMGRQALVIEAGDEDGEIVALPNDHPAVQARLEKMKAKGGGE